MTKAIVFLPGMMGSALFDGGSESLAIGHP